MFVVAKRLDGSRFKMPLGTKVGLGPDYNVLDGEPAPLRKGAHAPILGPCPLHVANRLDGLRIKMSPRTRAELGLTPGDRLHLCQMGTALEQRSSAKLCSVVQGMGLRNFRRGYQLAT